MTQMVIQSDKTTTLVVQYQFETAKLNQFIRDAILNIDIFRSCSAGSWALGLDSQLNNKNFERFLFIDSGCEDFDSQLLTDDEPEFRDIKQRFRSGHSVTKPFFVLDYKKALEVVAELLRIGIQPVEEADAEQLSVAMQKVFLGGVIYG